MCFFFSFFQTFPKDFLNEATDSVPVCVGLGLGGLDGSKLGGLWAPGRGDPSPGHLSADTAGQE